MRTLRNNRRPLGLVLSALLLVWQIQQPLAGATLIWDADTLTSGAQDGAGNWTVGGTTFWNGTSNVATTSGLFADIAQFGVGGAGGTINVDTQSIRGLVFGPTTSGYTLTSGAASTLTIGTSGITLNSGAQPVTVGSTNLGLALGTNASIINNSGGLFTVGGALNTAGNALTFDGNSSTTVSGIISGAGAIAKNGSADLNLNGVNTGTGAITVNNGKIVVGASAKLSGAAAVNINSGGTVQITGGTNTIDDGSVVTVNAGGTLLLNGGATETIARLAGAGLVDRTVTGTQVLTVNNTTSNTFSGIIQNSGGGTLALTKTNTNTLTLSGTSSTYTGATIINRGIITVSSLQNAGVASSLGAPTGTTSDITFNNSSASQSSGLTYAGTTAASTDRALSIALGSGAITTAHTITISNTSTAAGASLVFTSNLKNTTNTSALAPTLIFSGTNPAADVNEFRGNLINSTATGTKLLNVSKTGSNTWKLGGTNTYTGTTAISAGTLIFGKQVSLYNNTPASWTATNITVSSGATLGLNVGGVGEFTAGNVATIAALGTATNGFLGGSAIALDTTNATGNFVLGTSLTNTNAGANALGLTKLGTGTLELTAANSYTGTTTVAAGTLLVSGAGNIGSGGVTMTGGTLDLGGTTPTVGAVSLSGTSTLQNGSLSGTSYAASPAAGNTVTVTANLLANGASGLAKSGAGVLSVSGSNTFTGGVSVTGGGTLQFSTVSDNGGPASNLGQGTDGLTVGAGILSFVGAASQTTNRAISATGGTGSSATGAATTLEANGTNGAVITYTGPISAAGNYVIFSGNATSSGVISGGITQTGTTADLYNNSGTWNFSGTPLAIADDFVNTGATTVTNLNSTGVLGYLAGTSNGLYIRNGATVNLNANDVNGAGNSGGLDFILMGDVAGTPATLNTNTFSLTTPRLDLGAALIPTGEGTIIGTGTLTVGTSLNLYRGSIAANLTGAAALLKQSPGTVTLSGDTSGLTGVTTLSRGTLALDYTTNNTSKLSDTAVVSAAGGTLSLIGNASAATSETIGGITIGVGSTRLVVNNGTGQTAALNVNGITRSAIGGTLDVTLSSGSASVATSTTNGAGNILGGWATVGGSNFATVSGGNIIAFTSTGKDDVSTWSAGDDVTDSSGFTGSLNNLSVSSLRFGAAGAASTVTINADNRLNITNNGILVAPAVGSGAASITGGILSGGTLNEIIVHQNNPTAPFVIGSSILGGSALTKTGAGTLNLTGNNTFHGTINVNDGTLIPSGGKAIGDFSLVALKSNGTSVLDLNNGTETIGALSSTAVFSSTGIEDGLVSIGTGTLTINNTAATRIYQGSISGTGTLIKNGVSSQQLFGGASGGFTGNVIINQGLLDLSEGATVLNTASSIVINGPGELISDQETSANVDHIGNTTPITLNNTASGRGLWVRNPDQGAGRAETVGAITLGFGHNVIQVDENGAAAASARTITATAASLDRGTNHATLLVRGQMLGLSSGERGQLIFTAAPSGAIGGGGAAATPTITIFPYMVGESAAMTDATLTDNYGNSFVMNTGTTNGLRPLDLTTEYTLNQAGFDALTGMALNNVRFALNPAGTLAGTATQINSLVLDSSTEALAVNGPASSLNIKSGAILATTTTPANGMSLGGFTGLTTDAGNDYIVYVTNPTSTFTASALPLLV